MRHGNQASLLVYYDSSLSFGKSSNGTVHYTPEEEFSDVSLQHHLHTNTYVMGGAKVAVTAKGIVTYLCEQKTQVFGQCGRVPQRARTHAVLLRKSWCVVYVQ